MRTTGLAATGALLMRELPSALPMPVLAGSGKGHYESRFVRLNHPDLPLAFWLRHTVRIPRDPCDQAVGEVWGIFFDGQRKELTHLRRAWPLAQCLWGPRSSLWEIGTSSLAPASSRGQVLASGHPLLWDLHWKPRQAERSAASVLLPRFFYDARIPTPKTLTLDPLAEFDGYLRVSGRHIDISGWTGSNNHNWGARHSESYAWSQVCGFDGEPGAYFEGVSIQPRMGSVQGPRATLLLLRLDGIEYALNGLVQALRTRSAWTRHTWTFDARSPDGLHLCGHVMARPELTVRLRYDSPCATVQTCENSKLAACSISLSRPGQATRKLHAAHRAALETLAPGWDGRLA